MTTLTHETALDDFFGRAAVSRALFDTVRQATEVDGLVEVCDGAPCGVLLGC